MAIPVVLPKQGNSVESCILIEWKKQPGEHVEEGEIVCEIETDKAVLELPSPADGTLLAHFFAEGDDVPVMVNIAALGESGEDVDDLRPEQATVGTAASAPQSPTEPATAEPAAKVPDAKESDAKESDATALAAAKPDGGKQVGVSPRARNLARRKEIDLSGVHGSGPEGRIIERDVEAALAEQPKLSPVAKAMVKEGGYQAPSRGSGPGGRIMSHDLEEEITPAHPAATVPEASTAAEPDGEEPVERIPVRGVRKVIAERMLSSVQTTAQLTLHSSADARSLLALRKRLKASDPALGLQEVTINDLLLFAVARTLPNYPMVNALLADNEIMQYSAVHLGFAVDTPRGLLVPVIRNTHRRSLREIAAESKRLAQAAQQGNLAPDDMNGGTFTVTNLGNLGVEQFTPILNPPQVGILGVGSIQLKPVATEGPSASGITASGITADSVEFAPHIGLSLTINHQVVDGAPGARFLQALGAGLRELDLLLAL